MQDYTGREEVIFEQARQLPATERSAYLERACGGNAELRRRVEGLLATRESSAGAADLLASPPGDDEWPTGMPRPAIPGQRVGPYKLLEEIGEGGGGKVFLAEQEQPVRRRVALKIIKLGMDTEDVIARFEAERQALAMMDHPNIARVLDAGATPTGRPYFVMEFVKGVPITQFCDEHKLSIADRLQLFILVCHAVQHAHQKGIIHRDIKPSNILVSMNDGVPLPKVIDFGIAKATGGRLTDKNYYTLATAEQFIGTPAYMSPEQAAITNVDVDTRSDIYSLGVLLYELLTGCTPLDQEKLRDAGVDEVRRSIREEEPPRPSARLAQLSHEQLVAIARLRGVESSKLIAILRGDLDWIVMRCLEKDRQRRYETASALAQDLHNYLDNVPVSARPPSAVYLLQKMARRHRTLFASVAAVTLALVLGLGAALWSAHQERVQRTRADEEAANAKVQSANAVHAEEDTKRALSRVDYLIATNLVQEDRLPEAVAHLVRALGDSPVNPSAATLLSSALTMRNWLVPVSTNETTVAYTAQRGGPRGGNFGPRGNGQNLRGFGGRGAASPRGGTGARGGAASTPITSKDGARSLRLTRGTVEVFDTGKTTPNFSVENVLAANLSADGRWAVVALQDHTVRLLEAANGQPVAPPIRPEGDVRGADALSISDDDHQVIAKSSLLDPAARNVRDIEQTWNYVENPALLMTFRATRGVTSFGLSPDGKSLFTIAGDNSVNLWNAATGQPIGEPLPHDQPVRNALFSPDGQRLVTVTQNALRIWNTTTGQPVTAAITDDSTRVGGPNRPGPGLGRGGSATRVSFSPDGRKILYLANDRSVRVLDAATGQDALPTLHTDAGFSFASFSPDSKKILTLGAAAQIWDTATGTQVLEFAQDITALDSAAFSPDGKQVLTTAGVDAQVWDAATGQAVGDAIHQSEQNISAAFSPDGARILTYTAGADGAARVWDAATGLPKSALMQNPGVTTTAAFSPDGRWVITSPATARGPNGAIPNTRIWDAATGLAVSVPFAGVQSRFGPGSQRLYVIADDGTLQVWPFSTQVQPAWLLDLAATLAQCQLDSTGSLVFYAGKSYADLKTLAAKEPATNEPLLLWAKNLLGLTMIVK